MRYFYTRIRRHSVYSYTLMKVWYEIRIYRNRQKTKSKIRMRRGRDTERERERCELFIDKVIKLRKLLQTIKSKVPQNIQLYHHQSPYTMPDTISIVQSVEGQRSKENFTKLKKSVQFASKRNRQLKYEFKSAIVGFDVFSYYCALCAYPIAKRKWK